MKVMERTAWEDEKDKNYENRGLANIVTKWIKKIMALNIKKLLHPLLNI